MPPNPTPCADCGHLEGYHSPCSKCLTIVRCPSYSAVERSEVQSLLRKRPKGEAVRQTQAAADAAGGAL